MYSENFVSKKLKNFAEKNEWLISGEYIYGEEQGFLFSGLDGKGQKTFITPVPKITPEQTEDLFNALEKNRDTMKLQEYTISDDFLCIRIKDSMQLKTDDIEFILALLVGTMQELFIEPVGICQECGKTGADTENFIFDLYCYLHEDCAAKLDLEIAATNKGESEINEADQDDQEASNEDDLSENDDINSEISEYEDNSSNDASLKKVLFTIGGAVLGSIPWLILPFVMDLLKDLIAKVTENALITNFTQSLLTCICAYLVSYFAIIGYRLSKSKMDTKGRWIIGIVSIAVVILVQFVSLAILIVKEPTVTLTFSNYLTNLSKSNFYVNILLGALIGIVFTLIAVLPFFDSALSSEKAKSEFLAKSKAKKSLESKLHSLDSSEVESKEEPVGDISADSNSDTENGNKEV